jgi:preprotein translocase subunit YajC
MFISPAYAQAGAPAGGGAMSSILMLVLIFGVFYFLLIRPQRKRVKEHEEKLKGIRRGDRIVTNGGIIGTVVRAQDGELNLEIAEGVRVRVLRSMVADVLAKTEPVKGGKNDTPKNDMEEAEDAETGADATAPTPVEEGKSKGLKGLLSGKKDAG